MANWKGIIGKGFTADQFHDYVRDVQLTSWRPQFVVLHNTYIPRLSDWHQVPGEQRMRNLEAYYRDTQGWSAGPHLFVADDLIWIFTPLNTPGVHSPSWNAISWGVELVGDYTVEPFSASVSKNATQALAALHALAGVDPQTVRLHKDDPKTTHKNCPGPNIVRSEVVSGVYVALNDIFPGEHTPGAVA
jgi:N-acetylmuramoyl-L-alanine amidase